jgi:GAF domain-containing protein
MDEQTRLQGEVRALYAITSAINGNMNQQELLATMLETTCRELHYKAATVRLLDEERQTLNLKAAYGLSEAYLTKGEVAVSQSGIDQAALNGERVIVADVSKDARFQYGAAAAQEGLASALVVPLKLQDGIIGVLRVYTAAPHTFTEQEQDFLEAVANLGAQAIQRSRLYQAFGTMAHDLTSTLELKEVLATLLLESVEHLNVKAGSIRLLGPNRETLHLAAAYGLSKAYLEKGAVLVAQSPIDQKVLNEAQPVTIADLQKEFQYPEAAQREGIRSVLVVPLRVRGTTIGVMRMYSQQVRRFSTEAITFATTVADLGAVAIENARLHEALKARLEALKEDTDGWYRFLTLS